MATTKADKLVNLVKNNKAGAIIIFIATVIIALSTFLTSVKSIKEFFGWGENPEQKKNSLLAYRLGSDMAAVNFVLFHTDTDSVSMALIKKNAQGQLDILQNKMEQLKLKIDLNKMYETVDSKA